MSVSRKKKPVRKSVHKAAAKASAKTPAKAPAKPAKASKASKLAKSRRVTAQAIAEEPNLAKLLEGLKNSPSYKSAADDDPAFLAHPLTRGVRLQLDYYKPEVVMREHRIGGGVVVFGSARTPEPAVAERKLNLLQALLQAKMKMKGAKRDAAALDKLKLEVAQARRVVRNSQYYDMAREFGRLVSNEGAKRQGPRLVVITGGGPGIMEAANRGAYDAKAPNVGFNISLPHEQWPNPYITPELCFNFHYFAIRKLHFVMRAKALVAFPGGFGTLDELFEILTLAQTRRTRPRPVVLVGKAFWDRVFSLDALVEEGVIDAEDKNLLRYAETAQEAWDAILEWYAEKGQPLVDNPEVAKPVVA